MNIPEYELLEELQRNEWHALHRARREQDGRPVLLKIPHRDSPRTVDTDLLKREHRTLSLLNVTGVVRPHALVTWGGGACLVLEDPGAKPLRIAEGSTCPDIDTFLHLATQVATILGELHHRDIVHQNLNPQSILVHPETGEVWLGDFGLASVGSRERPAPLPVHALRAVLPYVSPEQTGRMNRMTDYRSDFYSLGVTLYELLTGSRPFVSDDPLELMHWHIAKLPPAPTEINNEIPQIVSRIVMTLLAKTAEERYQSALGLRADLERCRREWASLGRVTSFPLRQRDIPDRFLLPQKLYGRTNELEALAKCFDGVCDGPTAMVVVAGYAGIGKTALIQELYKPLARQRGYFSAGKFDQIVRDIPYGALIQAFCGLIQQILAESEGRLATWRARLSRALGSNGGVLAEVIPEIELIMGSQPSPPVLAPPEAQNRFQRALQQFVGGIAQREHPLVVFLDDLQWADSATLNILVPLLTSADVRHLLLIGAFRDNEVDATHPVMTALHRVESAGARVHRITLGPLERADLTLLIQDTLHGTLSDAESLAALVLQKTAGNPFFVLQFLKTLRQDGLLDFDEHLGHWTVRMEVRVAAMTDNVIDLMTRKIRKLPPATQRALTLAACIGNPIDPNTLAIVSEQSVFTAIERLEEALMEGLVQAADPSYTDRDPEATDAVTPNVRRYLFVHDRVQQAAYALIPAEDLPHVHLMAGRLLLQRSADGGEDRLFDIVHHLNRGGALIGDEGERLRLARLNLLAGRKAKSATAYQVALGYFQIGIELLSEACWESAYALAFSLHLEAAECMYLCGEFAKAECAFDRLLTHAQTRLDKSRIYALKILQYEHTSRYTDAIRTGREGIGLFGFTFPDLLQERQLALDSELAAIDTLLGGRAIQALIDLPIMTDPETRALMRLLSNFHTSCFLSGDKPLTLLNTATMVHLSLRHGNLEESAYAYALYAAMLEGPIRENYRAAYEFGVLAIRLNERLQDPSLRAKVLMMFAWAISLWRMPLEASFPHTQEAFRLGNETGLFVDAAWALFNEIWFGLLTCADLGSFSLSYAAHVDYSVRIRMPHIADAKRVLLQWGRALQGLTVHPCSLTDATFDEDAYRRMYAGQRLFEMFFHVAKLAILYTFEDYEAARQAAEHAETVIRNDFKGTIWDTLRVFYHALTLTALCPGLLKEIGGKAEATLDALNRRLKWWAENSPHNFQAQHLIVSAEIARTHGRVAEAAADYEAAIDAAARYERPHLRALALELYAKFWRGRGHVHAAMAFLREARDSYARWGATAKVEALRQRYDDLLHSSTVDRQAGAGVPAPDGMPRALDAATAIKAAQAIAGEIELEKLLATLMRIALENAGAERGSLILERDGGAFVHARGTLDAVEVMVRTAVPLGRASDLPASIVNYVRRTSDALVLDDARTDDRYGNDPCVRDRGLRSVLCAPVISQGRLLGVVYVENNLSAGVFTPERSELMQVLASQAAISLENARLYDGMRAEVAARRRAEDELRAALSEVESLKNRLLNENVYLQEEIGRQHNFVEMVGNCPALLAVLRKVEQVAPTDSTVLITGETGTGKELIARAVHNRSGRKDRPLVKVNCSAISAGLVESELFGHVKGAFTGAIERRIGRFELADGGTIFLDEVAELPTETQVKLLRVLQEHEFEAVGSSKTVRVNVRVIAATNRNLAEAVQTGRFRPDLFYRLNVFPIQVPPLRERRTDISQLVMFFVSQFAKRYGKRVDAVSRATMERFIEYSWPGNIRELQNIIERAIVVCSGPVLELDADLVPTSAPEHGPPSLTAGDLAGAGRSPSTMSMPIASSSLEEVERNHILAVLERARGVIEGPRGAAQILNIHPNTLRSRMQKLGIKRRRHEMS